MRVINGLRGQCLLDVVVAARCHVDSLAISGLILVQGFSKKKHDCMAKVLFTRTILLGGDVRRINRFWKELMYDLLPGSFILALEHVLELCEGVSPVEADFHGPIVEIGNRLANGKLGTKFATVLMDFGFHLV
jgi:hypothetical protein